MPFSRAWPRNSYVSCRKYFNKNRSKGKGLLGTPNAAQLRTIPYIDYDDNAIDRANGLLMTQEPKEMIGVSQLKIIALI